METIDQIITFITLHLDQCCSVGLDSSIRFNILVLLKEVDYQNLLQKITLNHYNIEESERMLINIIDNKILDAEKLGKAKIDIMNKMIRDNVYK